MIGVVLPVGTVKTPALSEIMVSLLELTVVWTLPCVVVWVLVLVSAV